MPDDRRFSPSFERNIEPITQKLSEVLPQNTTQILELGSGSGQHTAHLARHFPKAFFQPSEYDHEDLRGIDAWASHYVLENVQKAVTIDITQADWRLDENRFDALLAFNVIHYAPWPVTESLFRHAGRYLGEDAKVIFYGPYRIDGSHTSDSNADFDLWLKEKNTEFAVRDIGEVDEVARKNGFMLDALHPMPANNFMPVFRRAGNKF